jgi:SAM-dependent methyltransferase
MLSRLKQTGISLARGQRILDVGCGSGLLLETICERNGCVGYGIDVDRRRIERARANSKHARFECGLFDPAKLDGQYDVVIASAIIEHVVKPREFLSNLRAALKPNSSLFVLTPNAQSLNYRILRSWWRELLSVGEHIYLFTPDSLERCGAAEGLELIKAGSDFDPSVLKPRFDSLRNAAITMWAIYCASVKRVATRVASPRRGDILFGHFRKGPG